jgi:hypothetical protein
MTTVPITDAIRKAAQDLIARDAALPYGRLPYDYKRALKAIADPASGRKVVDVDWWRHVHGDKYTHAPDLSDTAENQANIQKLKAMADPKRNPFTHERKTTEDILAKFKPKRPPPAPALEEYDRIVEARREASRRALEAAMAAIMLSETPPVYRPPKPRRSEKLSNAASHESSYNPKPEAPPKPENNTASNRPAPKASNRESNKSKAAPEASKPEASKPEEPPMRASNTASNKPGPEPKASGSSNRRGHVRASRESYNAYQRDLMRKRRAAAANPLGGLIRDVLDLQARVEQAGQPEAAKLLARAAALLKS